MNHSWRVVFVFSVLSLCAGTSSVSAAEPGERVRARALKVGITEKSWAEFQKLAGPEPDVEIIRKNVLNFSIQPDYSRHLTPEAIQKAQEFLAQNKHAFDRAETEYQVPRTLIASLLWVESRYGAGTGKQLVVPVFMSLLFADDPRILKELKKGFPPRLVTQKAKKKAKWALDELLALQELYARCANVVGELKGSISGAFGMSQFLPSSYLKYAVSESAQPCADLYKPADAILSVAHYLHRARLGLSLKSKRAALYRYNKSRDYGSIIIQMADQLSRK